MDLDLNFDKLVIDKKKYEEFKKRNQTIFDTQLETLPKNIQFCSKCVTPNQRPRTEFNKDGICNACLYSEQKFNKDKGIDWKKREKELIKLLDKHRSKDGSWDCIVPSSHGKDSALVAHQLKHQYGMHPLTVTWAPFIYTRIGWLNFYNMTQKGFDGLTAWPNGITHRKLARVGFEVKGDPFEAFVNGQKAYPFQVAWKFKIPLIFYGENGEVEYGGSFKNVDKSHESPEDWEEEYYKGVGFDKVLEIGNKMGIISDKEFKDGCFDFYRAPPLNEIKKLGLQMHWWSYYKPWLPQENYYYASEHTGFTPNDKRTDATYTKFASIDDRLDPFHWYLAYIKFGYGRASRDASSDIRCGHITREEGVALAQKYDHEFPKTYFKEFLQYLDITEEHFWKIIDKYRLSHIWEKTKGKWKRKYIVSNKSKFGEKPKTE